MNILLLKELINKDGSRIKGDEPFNQANSMSTTNITTDDFVHMTRQGISRYSNYGRFRYHGESDETKEKAKLPKKDKKKKYPKKLKEEGKNKMNSLIEDIFTKKDFDKEFVKKNIGDLKLNGIQDLDTIRETNPILIRKVSALKDIIEKNSVSGEEKAIILNHLLSMDLSDIPSEYKQELRKKL